MRISLLQMTFGKHIDRKLICFFAGAVSKNTKSQNRTHLILTYFFLLCLQILDEVFNVLRSIRTQPQRPHDMTEELYDLTTMAMEYFKEHLEPRLPSLMPLPVMNRSRFVDYSKSKYHSTVLFNSVRFLTLFLFVFNSQTTPKPNTYSTHRPYAAATVPIRTVEAVAAAPAPATATVQHRRPCRRRRRRCRPNRIWCCAKAYEKSSRA